jgi:hypothetical protein
MRAGVPLVAAALWPLPDLVARPFSEAFYTGLTGGGTAAEALRSAQRAMKSARRFGHPYYWAPFTLWGDATAPLDVTGGDQLYSRTAATTLLPLLSVAWLNPPAS